MTSHSRLNSQTIIRFVTFSKVYVCTLTIYIINFIHFSEENEIHRQKHRKLRKGQGMAASTCISCSMYRGDLYYQECYV